MRNAIIRANRATASVSAKPRIVYPNSCCFKLGFRAYPRISDPKTIPTPAPTPVRPTVAIPAPRSLADCTSGVIGNGLHRTVANSVNSTNCASHTLV